MNVDRMKYLGLVTAIAAAGCVITEKDSKDNDGGGGVGGTAGAGGTAGSGGEATGGSGGDATGGAGGAGGGTTCDDSVGTPAECTTVATDCVPYCNAAHQNLKPAVAEAAVACLALDQEDICPTGYDCLTDALAAACADSTTATDCTDVATNCAAPVDPACEDGLDGMTTAGRTEVMTCVTEGGTEPCEWGFYSCMEGAMFIP